MARLLAERRNHNGDKEEGEKSWDTNVNVVNQLASKEASCDTSTNQDEPDQPRVGVQVLDEARGLDQAAASVVGGFEFERAFVRVLNERELFLVKSSSFSWVAHNIERNSPTSGSLAESALRIVRRCLCNEADAGNISIVVSEDIL